MLCTSVCFDRLLHKLFIVHVNSTINTSNCDLKLDHSKVYFCTLNNGQINSISVITLMAAHPPKPSVVPPIWSVYTRPYWLFNCGKREEKCSCLSPLIVVTSCMAVCPDWPPNPALAVLENLVGWGPLAQQTDDPSQTVVCLSLTMDFLTILHKMDEWQRNV